MNFGKVRRKLRDQGFLEKNPLLHLYDVSRIFITFCILPV